MSAVGSKAEICNIALSKLGQVGTVENIDTPETAQEKTFAKWYEVVRELALKEQKPNFAIARRRVAENSAVSIPFGYAIAYEYPNDCLALLGIGEQQAKSNDYSIEIVDKVKVILTDQDYTDATLVTTTGLPIRFIQDIIDVSMFTSEFVLLLASMLADKVCYEITEDDTKKKIIQADKKDEKASSASLNSQENRPIKVNNSKWKQRRIIDSPTNHDKK